MTEEPQVTPHGGRRGHLPDLSALVSGLERRRRRRSARAFAGGSTILQWLGVDAIWISPIYPSPMADFGYDVADYYRHRSAVRHAGRFRRADRRGARARPEGHSRLRAQPHSDQHPWFVESRSLARQSEARLVHLARPAPGRRAAQQLAQQFRRLRLGAATRPPANTTTTPS